MFSRQVGRTKAFFLARRKRQPLCKVLLCKRRLSLQYRLSGEGRDGSARAGLGREYMEIRARHGLTHKGSWKPSHHDADKDLILHCEENKPKKSQIQHSGLQDLSEWASPSKTLLLLPPQIPHVQPLALLAQPTPRAQDSRAAKREVGTSMTSWWQAGEATQVVGA